MKATTSITLLFGLLGFGTASFSDPLPVPSQAFIESFGHQGAGCPAGSTSAHLSEDRQALTILFDNYLVEGGTASANHQGHVQKDCAINLRMRVPAGYSFSIFTVDYRGFAGLDAGTRGFHRSFFKWAQSPVGFKALASRELHGPYRDDYQLNTRLQFEALSWSPCTGTSQDLTLLSRVEITGRNGFIAVDSFDGQLIERFGINWRPCTDPGAGFPIGKLGTAGAVARDTSLCLNFRSGQLTLTSAAPNRPGQPYARLTHYATALTGQSRELKRDSFGTQRTDTYRLPGDWNNVRGLSPEVTAKPAVRGAPTSHSVEQVAPDTTCVRFHNGPANMTIRWNPIQ